MHISPVDSRGHVSSLNLLATTHCRSLHGTHRSRASNNYIQHCRYHTQDNAYKAVVTLFGISFVACLAPRQTRSRPWPAATATMAFCRPMQIGCERKLPQRPFYRRHKFRCRAVGTNRQQLQRFRGTHETNCKCPSRSSYPVTSKFLIAATVRLRSLVKMIHKWIAYVKLPSGAPRTAP